MKGGGGVFPRAHALGYALSARWASGPPSPIFPRTLPPWIYDAILSEESVIFRLCGFSMLLGVLCRRCHGRGVLSYRAFIPLWPGASYFRWRSKGEYDEKCRRVSESETLRYPLLS